MDLDAPRARTVILTDAGTLAFSTSLAAYDGTPTGTEPILPTPVDTTAPTITSAASHTTPENTAYGATATANEAVTWTKGGADAALITLNATTGLWSIPGQNYEARPTVTFTLTARDAANNASAPQTITLTIRDVDEIAPTITSPATYSVNEGAPLSGTSTASETVTWTKGGANASLVTLNATTGAWSIAAQDYAVRQSVVWTRTATDAAGNASAPQTVTIAINDVVPTSTLTSANAQARMDQAVADGVPFVVDADITMATTGLHPKSNLVMYIDKDIYNDHASPSIGTQGVFGNTSGARVSNITVIGRGGVIRNGPSPTNGANRKGLTFIKTDGFVATNIMTAGALNGFAMHVEDCTNGVITGGSLLSGANQPGPDGAHAYNANSNIVFNGLIVSSGDDARTTTIEGNLTGIVSVDVVHDGGTADTKGFSCIKVDLVSGTNCTIQRATFRNLVGRVTEGPTGAPIRIQNHTAADKNSVVIDTLIDGCDTDIGATTLDGPHVLLENVIRTRITNGKLRGRVGQYIVAKDCDGVFIRAECFDTIVPGYIQAIHLEGCKNVDILLTLHGSDQVAVFKDMSGAAITTQNINFAAPVAEAAPVGYDPSLGTISLSNAVHATTGASLNGQYPPKLAAVIPVSAQADQIRFDLERYDKADIAFATVLQTYSGTITQAQAAAGSISGLLTSITAPFAYRMRLRSLDGTRYGPPSNVVVNGDLTAPTLTSTAAMTYAESQPLAAAVTFNEPVNLVSITGTDAALLEVLSAQPSTTLTLSLVGGGDLDTVVKANYAANVSVVDLAGNSTAVAVTIAVNAVDEMPDTFDFAPVESGAAASTVTTSNTVMIAGLGTGVSAKVTASGSGAQVRKGSGGWVASTRVVNGDSLTARLTTGATNGLYEGIVKVGRGQSTYRVTVGTRLASTFEAPARNNIVNSNGNKTIVTAGFYAGRDTPTAALTAQKRGAGNWGVEWTVDAYDGGDLEVGLLDWPTKATSAGADYFGGETTSLVAYLKPDRGADVGTNGVYQAGTGIGGAVAGRKIRLDWNGTTGAYTYSVNGTPFASGTYLPPSGFAYAVCAINLGTQVTLSTDTVALNSGQLRF